MLFDGKSRNHRLSCRQSALTTGTNRGSLSAWERERFAVRSAGLPGRDMLIGEERPEKTFVEERPEKTFVEEHLEKTFGEESPGGIVEEGQSDQADAQARQGVSVFDGWSWERLEDARRACSGRQLRCLKEPEPEVNSWRCDETNNAETKDCSSGALCHYDSSH